MSVNGIEALGAAGFTPMTPPVASASAPTTAAAPSVDFGNLVLDGLDRLDGVQRTADQLAVQAATGNLANLHDYTIAATEAQVTTQMTVAVRNKAVEAFNEIMRMQVG
ncbi:flagellar hook-basal body complex protein FliE [Nocardioides rubriscoriae]|uniref:flagellar hook-basal body complex protein FliE n=1 Tax=Nocardioides rubriscoriae TaxID=642762 RepID=UPI0011DF2367|nr:flagellar hook-basal body complex protein FliE [Nocardioides rubriscoriae]